jgi:hypothetical protein
VKNVTLSLTVIISIIITSILVSCHPVETTSGYDSDFIKMLVKPEVKDINHHVILKLDPAHPETYRVGDAIYLVYSNQSEYKLYFPVNGNNQLFAFDKLKKRWIVIPNLAIYKGSDYYLPPQGQGNNSSIFPVKPDIQKTPSETVRVCVTGFIMNGTTVTETPVSACIDVNYALPFPQKNS